MDYTWTTGQKTGVGSHSLLQRIFPTQDWTQASYIAGIFFTSWGSREAPIPRKHNAKECSNYLTIALISHTREVMFKIFEASLRWYVNWELPDVQAGFRKCTGNRDQIANIYWIVEKAREFQKNIYFCFIDYAKAFNFVNHNKLWIILRDGNTRPPYLHPEKSVWSARSNSRTKHGTTDWFQIGMEYVKAVYCHPANLTWM